MRSLRPKLIPPLLVLMLTVGAIIAVWALIQRIDTGRGEQLKVAVMTLSLSDLQSAPFNAEPSAGGDPARSLAEIRADESSIAEGLRARTQNTVSPRLLIQGRSQLTAIEPVVAQIYRIAIHKGGLSAQGGVIASLQKRLTSRSGSLTATLAAIGYADADSAEDARAQAKLGASVAMGLLLLAFAFFYFRAIGAREAVERLARQNESLLGVSRVEARTDALTGLGNRRALTSELKRAMAEDSHERELLLTMFDLDGFKQYNDTFGHAAGDALLQRLGGRLKETSVRLGSAYRMGGDEFCMLARCGPEMAEQLLNESVAALEEGGEGWHVGCSHGAVWIPSEAASESRALKLADERMYTNKASRSSASRQATDVLLQVITEQDGDLDHHSTSVSRLAEAVAELLACPRHEVQQIGLAATLHDVGKTAIPASILAKPGPLDEKEWEFVHRHPLIGERIALAAPSLAHIAPLIRSSHERLDGHGYPDGLQGHSIPLGSRIIAVCDAFDAMTSGRPYRDALTAEAAVAELERHSATQFDPEVVAALCEQLTHSPSQQHRGLMSARAVAAG
jgi:diguanylate cyclase (GGDEF)-like protein